MENIDAFSDEFKWKGCAGEFAGISFSDTHQTYNRVMVWRIDPNSGKRLDFHIWDSVDPKGNTLAEFEAWRLRATGHTPYGYLSEQPEFKKAFSLWRYAPRCACGESFPCDAIRVNADGTLKD